MIDVYHFSRKMSSDSHSPNSNKSKCKRKQPDLREFMFKRMKSQETTSSSPAHSQAPHNDDISNENDDVDAEVGSPSTSNSPLEDLEKEEDVDEDKELVYEVELLPHDPGKRINIMDYPSKQRNAVGRAYILKKPCQPTTHNFPQREYFGLRRFGVNWFKKWDWLEYIIEKDVAFCFVCFLFKNDVEINKGGDAFVNGGFRSWNKPDRFNKHAGGTKSAHNLAYEKYVNLRDGKKKAIVDVLDDVGEVTKKEYHIRLKAFI